MDLIKFSDALNELISNYPPQDAKYYLAPINIFDVFSDIKKNLISIIRFIDIKI